MNRETSSITNAKNHTETMGTDPKWGTVTSRTGPNSLTTTYPYDGFGRSIREIRADGTFTDTARKWAWGNAPTGAVYYTETRDFHNTSSPVAISSLSAEFFDAFGRSIRRQGVNGDGRAVATDTSYDNKGRAYRTSAPFYVENGPTIWTTTQSYDLLDRPLEVRTPDDEVGAGYVATTYSYKSLEVETSTSGVIGMVARVTNPKNIVTKTTTNSQGWTVEIVQNDTNVDLDTGSVEKTTTTFTHDVLGNVTETNAAGHTVTNVYDIRGRRIGTTDADVGTWTYEYNTFGELTLQEDENGHITTMLYDDLGRMTDRTITAASGSPEDDEYTEWTYDTATKGVGKLTKVETFLNGSSTVHYRESNTYDSLGRPATSTKRIDGVDYTTTLQYDAYSRLYRTTYPGGNFVTQNNYNANGVLKEVRRVDGSNNLVLWMAAPYQAYNAAGTLEVYLVGNGVSTERIYSEATGRLRGINTGRLQTTSPNVDPSQWGFEIQNLAYNYDLVGNVDVRNDGATGRYETYGYDALNRLVTQFISDSILATPTQIDVDYAANGNITYKSDAGTYQYNSGKTHAVTATVSGPYAHSYSYDGNGNMTSGAGRTIKYTAFNQVREITMSGATTTFAFGAGHERVKQVSPKGTTIYVGGHYEKFTPNGSAYAEHWHWVMTPAGRVAVHKKFDSGAASHWNYFHHDGIASVTAVTNPWGTVSQRFAYDAWGKRFDPDDTTTSTWAAAGITWATNSEQMTRGFTDHEHLDDLGLIHMNGRVYDPVLARFLSADPFIDGADDSQGYNRYSYVHNNPLNKTDPTGFLSLGDFVKIVAVVVISVVTYGAASGAAAGWLSGSAMSAGTASATSAAIGGAAAGFASGFAGSILNGESVGDAFKAGLIGGALGGITAGMAYGIGQQSSWGTLEKAFAHGATGGLVAEAAGGDFRHGFIAAFATKTIMSSSPVRSALHAGDRSGGWVAFRTAVAATVGGTVSVISGGKFANAAVTSAFQHLFNAEASASPPSTIDEYLELLEKDADNGITNAREALDRLKLDNVTIELVDQAYDLNGNPVNGFTKSIGGGNGLNSMDLVSAEIQITKGMSVEEALATLVHESEHIYDGTITLDLLKAQRVRETRAHFFEENYRLSKGMKPGVRGSHVGRREQRHVDRDKIKAWAEKKWPN